MKLYRIKKSDIDKKGRGLYATRDIKKGTKIIDYIGKLITTIILNAYALAADPSQKRIECT